MLIMKEAEFLPQKKHSNIKGLNVLHSCREELELTVFSLKDESPTSQPSVIDRTSGFSRPSCSRVSPPRLSTIDYTRPTSPSARSERMRPPVLNSFLAQVCLYT